MDNLSKQLLQKVKENQETETNKQNKNSNDKKLLNCVRKNSLADADVDESRWQANKCNYAFRTGLQSRFITGPFHGKIIWIRILSTANQT